MRLSLDNTSMQRVSIFIPLLAICTLPSLNFCTYVKILHTMVLANILQISNTDPEVMDVFYAQKVSMKFVLVINFNMQQFLVF